MNLRYLFLLVACVVTMNACQNEEEPAVEVTPTGYQQFGTPFNNVPQTEDIVMYEVNLRAYSSAGNLQGVISKLDDIKSLGVNVIWLMPVYPQGQLNSVGSPYAVKDYKAVSTEYGNLQDLRNLTTQAHACGMTVILDWVANHTAWDNAWISNRDWYTQNSSGTIIHPAGTNWQDVADLNYNNQEMRAAMIDAMKYWVYEANVDGFRCDYADGVPRDFWAQAWQEMRAIPNRKLILFAEGNRADHFNAWFDMNFGWDFYSAIKNVYQGQPASNLFQAAIAEYAQVPAGKQVVRFTTNHDESAWDATPVSIFNGINGALSAQAVTVFIGGVPLIYGSQEVGRAATVPFFTNSAINWNDNPSMLSSYRKMMQFYNQSAVARKGVNTVHPDNDVVFFKKELAGDQLLVLANTRNSVRTISIPAGYTATNWTNVMTQQTTMLTSQLTLQPYEFYILD